MQSLGPDPDATLRGRLAAYSSRPEATRLGAT